MNKLLLVAICAASFACSKKDTYELVTSSVLSNEEIIVARYNGNSGTKREDCEIAVELMKEKFPSRSYVCRLAR